ncbi:hypothetical protein GCM10027577_36900 [Spirosoma fluminis]
MVKALLVMLALFVSVLTAVNAQDQTIQGDTYYRAQYLGRGYVAKVFTYAAQDDPTAELFINDYNLESSNIKLDSLPGLMKELQAQKVPIAGIGT